MCVDTGRVHRHGVRASCVEPCVRLESGALPSARAWTRHEPRAHTTPRPCVREGIEPVEPSPGGLVTVGAGDSDEDPIAGNHPDAVGACSARDSPSVWGVVALGGFLPRRRTA